VKFKAIFRSLHVYCMSKRLQRIRCYSLLPLSLSTHTHTDSISQITHFSLTFSAPTPPPAPPPSLSTRTKPTQKQVASLLGAPADDSARGGGLGGGVGGEGTYNKVMQPIYMCHREDTRDISVSHVTHLYISASMAPNTPRIQSYNSYTRATHEHIAQSHVTCT